MRVAEEATFTADDGTALFYRHWPAQSANAPASAAASGRALILFHRGHEHSGRWQETVEKLGLGAMHVFAWDARGHGRSPGARGHAPSFMTYVRDAERFVRHIETRHGIARQNMAVLGNSVGAVVGAAWVHDYAPPIRALVLASPALRVRLYVPFARFFLGLWRRIAGNPVVKSYVKGRLLTHDAAKAAAYDSDPLIARDIAVNVLLSLDAHARRLIADAAAITVPTQLLVAGADRVVDRNAQHRLFDRLGSVRKERHVFPGFFHDIFNERNNDFPIAAARRFIADAFAAPPARADLGQADRAGAFKDELDRLRAPLPFWSPRRWHFAGFRLSIRTIGRLSRGIRIGLADGFDSGPMLDYLYRDRAEGITPLGRLVDREFLDQPAWVAIRQRRRHMEAMLGHAIALVRGAGRPIHIAEIGAGGARYTLEAVRVHAPEASVLLIDHDPRSVETARARAAELGMSRVRAELGDGFDRAALARLDPAPTIAIASGLYELFPDNAPLRESLAGLAAAMSAGGCLVYTNMPWNPQLELAARALTTHREDRPWIMRRRSQAEIDQLVGEAGFEKVAMALDDHAIMSVSLARRVSIDARSISPSPAIAGEGRDGGAREFA